MRVLGLPAGSVSKVVIDGDQVRIDMNIPSDIAIPADATAQIVPQSLIGERYIQISPAFKSGMTAAKDGDVIEHTIIPVEPDEALAAIKKFLDSLDPDGIGSLVTNLEEDLRGNGASLNDALGSLSQLVKTFADNDDVLLRIVDSFDRLSCHPRHPGAAAGRGARRLRRGQPGAGRRARAASRSSSSGLADLSQQRPRACRESTRARSGRTSPRWRRRPPPSTPTSRRSTQLLAAGPNLATGIIGAYNPELRALNLRNNFSPLVTELLAPARAARRSACPCSRTAP